MEREEEEKKHFAVLIDADNISEKYASSIFNEIADYGYASYRRIYGNWAKGNGWKDCISAGLITGYLESE